MTDSAQTGVLIDQAQGKRDEAVDYYQKPLNTKREFGDDQGIAKTTNNLGIVYRLPWKWPADLKGQRAICHADERT
jgi:hypothetical protein